MRRTLEAITELDPSREATVLVRTQVDGAEVTRAVRLRFGFKELRHAERVLGMKVLPEPERGVNKILNTLLDGTLDMFVVMLALMMQRNQPGTDDDQALEILDGAGLPAVKAAVYEVLNLSMPEPKAADPNEQPAVMAPTTETLIEEIVP
jgi:hypothetical protein